MDRRAFITEVGGSILTAPLSARTQQPSKRVQIGILSGLSPSRSEEAFRRRLRDLRIHRGAEGHDRVSICRWAIRKAPRSRCRAGAAPCRCNRRLADRGNSCRPTSDQNHPHRHGDWWRSCGARARREPRAPGWEHYRANERGYHPDRQAAGVPESNCSDSVPGMVSGESEYPQAVRD